MTDAVLADLPGYGYAAVPKQDKLRWQQVMANYLVTRENLKAVVLMCDPRHGLTELDDILLEVIRPRVEQGLKFLLLLTKADKLNRSEQAKALSIARLQAGGGEVKLFSALKKQGVEETAAAAVAVGAPGRARHDRNIPASPAARHHAELPRRRRARPPRADVPARLSRSGLRLGRAAGTFRPPRERRLPLRGAQPARLREIQRSPADVKAYRAKHLVQDIAALIAIEGAPLDCLVAHDWGGAVAWNLANQLPELTRKLAIINSPHPGTFLRELKSNPTQQAASAYMNFLIRPDAEAAAARGRLPPAVGLLHALGRRALADRSVEAAVPRGLGRRA